MAYTTIDNPELHFQCKIYTGNGGTLSLTLDGDEDMQPDLVWVKSRTQNNSHVWFDVIRTFAGGKEIQSNNTGIEGASDSGGYGYVSAVGSDGFTVQAGSTAGDYTNVSSQNYVAWCFKAGTSFSNDASATSIGSIDSSGSTNQTAGFSIATFDLTSQTGNETVKHGLSTAPGIVITKRRSGGAGDWTTYIGPTGNSYGVLNKTDAFTTSANFMNNTAPTSSVFTIGDPEWWAQDPFVSYCFNEVKGFSKFGTYVGTGAASTAPFRFTGFKPAFLIVRETDGSDGWGLYDNKRNPGPGNVNGNPLLQAQSSDAESNAVANQIDFLSNGFRVCAEGTNGNFINEDGKTYFYAAFAEVPFVNSNGVPCNAK